MAFVLERLSDRELAHEQRVVLHEWRQRIHNSSSGRLLGAISQQLFPVGHPYHLRGDEPDDVRAIELPHVQWLAQGSYRPDRATLVVTGAIDLAATRAWVAQYFGAVRAHGAPLSRVRAGTVTPLAQHCRIDLAERAVDERLVVSWRAPPRFSDDDAALDVIAALLVGDARARLTRALTAIEGGAAHVDVTHEKLELASTFSLSAWARAGERAERLLPALDAELGRLRSDGLNKGELESARAIAKRARRLESSSLLERAVELSLPEGPPDLARDLARYDHIEASVLLAVLTRWLAPERRVITIVPHEKWRDRDRVSCAAAGGP